MDILEIPTSSSKLDAINTVPIKVDPVVKTIFQLI